jgi:hypothetical protein
MTTLPGRSMWFVSVALLIAALLLAPCAWAQTTMGAISGTVRDQSGAVVPNVSVLLTNTATNVSETAKTNEAGFYIYPAVTSGAYRLTAESAGMQRFDGVFTVRLAERVVIDPVLQPGQVTTSVQVTDITPVISTDNATASNTLENERVNQLPINGRDVKNLLATIPGLESYRMFGSTGDAIEWVLNGSVITDRRWCCGPATKPALDSLQEFTVEANAVSAKVSKPTMMMMSTKNGTNQFHGTAFETARNNAIGLARSRTDNYTSPPPLNRHEFGVSAGGPVFIPKVYNGKNKTFWFFAYEGSKSAQSSTYSWNVPTAAMRSGDFSGLKDAQGRLSTVYNPWSTGANWSRQPFPGNTIPASLQSPLSKYLFSITPMPTNNVNPMVDYNWYGPEATHYSSYQVNTRIDHQFSDRDRLYGVVTEHNQSNLYPETAGGSAQTMLNNVAGYELDKNRLLSMAVNWAHTFSPTFFNELLLSGKRNILANGENLECEQDFPTLLGLPNPFGTCRWPQVNSILGNYAFITNDTKKNNENYIVLDENATKVHGRHELQFGGSFRRDLMNILPQQRWPAPQLSFGNTATQLYDPASTPTSPQAVPFTGANIANMYLGLATYGNTLGHKLYYLTQNESALYFQDNFKASSRLTLNLGLRWELLSPYHDKRAGVTGFSERDHAIVLSAPLPTLVALGATLPSLVNQYTAMGIKFETYQQAGLSEDQMSRNWKDFSPRFGFAYKALSGKSAFVVRGGYSLAYFFPQLADWLDNNRSNTPLAASYSYNRDSATQSPDGLSGYMMRSVPTVVAGVNSQNLINLDQATGITPGSSSIYYFDPRQPDSRDHTWNLTVEKEIWNGTLARLRYGGTHAGFLGQNYCYNSNPPSYVWYATTGQPTPTGTLSNIAQRPYDSTSGLGNVCVYKKSGWTNANGILVELERRFAKGYAFQASYAMTNAMGTNVGNGSVSSVAALNQFLPNMMPTDFHQLDRIQDYKRDTNIPKHRVKWNWVVDLPFGKGHKVAGTAHGFLNQVIGGWQLAGIGSLNSTYFTLPSSNWAFTGSQPEVYGYQYPIQNCTSSTCIPGYLWTNAGYIPANLINRTDASGKCTGICGVPTSYQSAVTPLIPWGSTTMPANAPANTTLSTYWDTNTVWLPLKNGTVQRLSYGPGWNPWQNQYLPGVRQWGLDASLFKVFPITERVRARLNADFFNVLNHPGNPNSVDSYGMEQTRSSGNSPRTLQLSLRVIW